MNAIRLLSLRKTDLLENPIWEYWVEGNQEYVRAVDLIEIRGSSSTVYIVATIFHFNNKSRYLGYCSPQHPNDLNHLQPVLILKDEHLPLFQNSEWNESDKSSFLHRLNLKNDEIFPMKVRSRVKCDNEYFECRLTGLNNELS